MVACLYSYFAMWDVGICQVSELYSFSSLFFHVFYITFLFFPLTSKTLLFFSHPLPSAPCPFLIGLPSSLFSSLPELHSVLVVNLDEGTLEFVGGEEGFVFVGGGRW